MKKSFSYLSFLFVIVLFSNSCEKTEPIDKCEGVVCNNGACETGDCICDYGWDGDDCSNKKVSSFYGNWTGELKCLTNTDTVTMRIEEIGRAVDIFKMNTVGLIFELGPVPVSFDSYTLNGIVDSTFNTFVIDTLDIKQVLPFNGNNIEVDISVSGKGKIVDTKLNLELDFFITQFNQSFVCKGIFDK